MNETLGRGYARIEAIKATRGVPPVNNADFVPPPPDTNQIVYITLVFAGIAFLLPFNTFIMAVDYFQLHFPNTSIMFDMTTVYIASACVAVVANNLMLELFSYSTRIYFGIIVSLSTMMFVTFCNIWWDGFTPATSYKVNLIAIGVVAFGCTIQQSSYYGFTGFLPPRYTQAVMAGESAAGFWISADRIFTKYIVHKSEHSIFMFFLFANMILFVHFGLHYAMMKLPFVWHFLSLTRESRMKRKIILHLNPNEDATLVESETNDGEYGVLKIQTPTGVANSRGEPESSTISFANPVYSPTTAAPPAAPPDVTTDAETPGTSYKVEDVVIESPEQPTPWKAFKGGLAARWVVARAIYPYMVSIGLVYFTTLSLYPGITSEVPSCRVGSWMPIILMTAFNTFDFLGKIASAYQYEWSRSQLLLGSGLRLLLVPLMLLCAAPRHSPHIVGDFYPIMFSVVLGFSNGLFGSVPMIMAPSRVGREYREIAGNMMTLSYNGGLLTGALVSYLLLGMLGPRTGSPCKVYPTPPLPTLLTPTTTTAFLTNVTQVFH